jgi:hypothetical protein
MGAKCYTCKNLKNNEKKISINSEENNNKIERKKTILSNTTLSFLIKNYIFISETFSKNDYYIEIDLIYLNTKEEENNVKYFNKWINLIKSGKQEKLILSSDVITKNDKNKNDKNDFFLNKTNNYEIRNFNSRNIFFSDIINRLQYSYINSQQRFIKYLTKGPPNNIRWGIWMSIILSNPENTIYTNEEYLNITRKNDKEFKLFYEDQIIKDVKRSNNGIDYLYREESEQALYRILKALAIIDPELGYCQGMNIITGNIFMISDANEFETFNMMIYLLKNLELREFFLNGFPKLIMFIFLFKEFIKEKFPNIQNKLEELDIPEELWIFKWMQTLFFITLPLSICVRLMDCILCFGLEFLLNFSLAYVKLNEIKINNCENMEDFLNIFMVFKFEDHENDIKEEINNNNKDIDREIEIESNKISIKNQDFNSNQNIINNKDIHLNQNIEYNLKILKTKINNINYISKIEKNRIQMVQNKINKYYEYFNFGEDIIHYRENLIRESKGLCIKEIIEKMIKIYSSNNIISFPVYYSESDNINNNYIEETSYYYQNTINNDNNNTVIRAEDISSYDSPYTDDSKINHDEEEEEISGNIEKSIEKEYSIYKKNYENHENEEEENTNNLKNMEEDKFVEASRFNNRKNNDSNFKKIDLGKSRKTQFKKLVQFIIPNEIEDKGNNFTRESKSLLINQNNKPNLIEKRSMDSINNMNSGIDIEYCITENNIKKKNNIYQDVTDGSTKCLLARTQSILLGKNSRNNIRQSLRYTFGRRLNIEQIEMMSKIKSKMDIIQSINANKKRVSQTDNHLSINEFNPKNNSGEFKSSLNENNKINFPIKKRLTLQGNLNSKVFNLYFLFIKFI